MKRSTISILSLNELSVADGPEDRGSIPGQMVPDAAMLNTQHYKERIKGSGAIQGME